MSSSQYLIVLAAIVAAIASTRAIAKAPAPAPGLISTHTQPRGGLSGKIIYAHGGHGYTADNKAGGKWTFQRGEGHEMIEDLGNIDQMSFLVDYLFRAGATIIPLRPVGHQTEEVVLDNGDGGTSLVGNWDIGQGEVFYGSHAQVPYRQTKTSKIQTAVARYSAKMKTSGFYPVYAWTSSGADRAPDQLYRIHYFGGINDVRVNHRRVGNGLIYLGTYYFDKRFAADVEISNQSETPDRIVVADMIRFGNGMGDIDRGGGISGRSREDESGLYWVKWHVDRAHGIPETAYRETDVDRQAAISFSPRYAAYMNREADGRLKDRVFVSFHSNSAGGKARGVIGLLNGNNDPTTATPNQKLLAKSLGQKVNDDLVAQAGTFEHAWKDRKDNTTLDRDDIDFGEINNRYINNEFDATIVEVAFHDSAEDADLMRDARVRDAAARATYQGLLSYFRAVDNNETPATRMPAAVTGVYVESNDSGSATIAWKAPETNSYLGDAASGYRIYASTNGYGFDGGTLVEGGDTTSKTFTSLDLRTTYYFKVAAVNEGGESPPSEVIAVLPIGGPKDVLIVNGFDRIDRAMAVKQSYGKPGNTVDRVWPRQINSRDYVIQVATAIQSAAPGTHVESTSNEAVISGTVDLIKYKSAIWILGKESTKDCTFDDTEQRKVEAFIAGGGNLFVSGSEIAWDLDAKESGREFCRKTLCTKFVMNDAAAHRVTGASGTVFDGLGGFGFDHSDEFPDGEHIYEVDSPDLITPEEGGMTAAHYAGDAPGAAAIQVPAKAGRGAVIVLGFPFETIATPTLRAAAMKSVLDFFHAK